MRPRNRRQQEAPLKAYQRFVAKHRLALAPTIEGLDLAMSRWDSLRIESITEPINTEHGVPPLFAMFNVLKSDYLAARLRFEECLVHYMEQGNIEAAADVHLPLGDLARMAGDLEMANSHYIESQTLFQETEVNLGLA